MLLKILIPLLLVLSGTLYAQQQVSKEKIVRTNVLPNPLIAEVIGIQDGDTIELKLTFTGKKAGHRMGMPLRIRLMHINCPERGKPFYKIAKQFTAKKCFRQIVIVKHANNFDRYGRLIGEVILADGSVLNKELVRSGYAVHFKKYSSDLEYAKLELQAKGKKLGIWSLETINLDTL